MIDKTQQMQALIDQLNQASDAYYNGRGELMSDHEWDALFDQLKTLEDETGTTLPDSPTQKVSEDNFAGGKEEHEFAALSLAKTKKPEDLVKWAEGRPIWLSWKLDGLTLVITFDNGHLTKVVTRGNGHIGTNITHLAKAINGIPQNIADKGHVVVRGEAVISYADFEQFNMESEETYANPRNLASGSLTLKDVEEVKQRHIQWIPFTLVYTEHEMVSWGERMQWLDSLGMKSVERERIDNPTIDNINKVIEQWNPDRCPYPVDGLVIGYDDTIYASTGSVTGHHATKAGYAFKWKDESAMTELDHIEWSCAANTISPVAVFRPVELEGTTVKRASLCNISECRRLDMGDQGTKIEVIKANKIIPKVISVAQKAGMLTIPNTCPVCGAPTEIMVSEASGTETLHCTNYDCPAKQLKKFSRFVSKEGMNIDGISEQTLARFINLGWISEYADIYRLPQHIHEIAALEGFGPKSASNMVRAIEKSRKVESGRLLYALNIPLCGQDVCKRLLQAYPISKLISLVMPSAQHDLFHDPITMLSDVPGIGPEKSASFVGYFQDEKRYLHYNHLAEQLDIVDTVTAAMGSKCQDLTFVVTGDVHHYKNRNALKAYIESQGGKVTGSVSKSTSFLINNDVTSTSGKNQKAHELNIPIISEDEFIERFGTEG